MKNMRELDERPPPLKIKINKQPPKEKPKKNIVVAQPVAKKFKDQAIQLTSRESLNFEYSSSEDESAAKGNGFISIQVQQDSQRKQYAHDRPTSPSAPSDVTRDHQVEVAITHEKNKSTIQTPVYSHKEW